MPSKTIVDMPKVCQMFDAGWNVEIFKNPLGSYTAIGRHREESVMNKLRELTFSKHEIPFVDEDGEVVTDDFTPEQALTRLAYKVHAEILGAPK